MEGGWDSMASREEAGGPAVSRPGVLGISRAIGQDPQPSYLGKGSFSSQGGRRW